MHARCERCHSDKLDRTDTVVRGGTVHARVREREREEEERVGQ